MTETKCPPQSLPLPYHPLVGRPRIPILGTSRDAVRAHTHSA